MLDLYLGGHMQFGSVHGHHIIQSAEDQDGYNYGKICYQGATLGEKQETTRRSWGTAVNTIQTGRRNTVSTWWCVDMQGKYTAFQPLWGSNGWP